MNTSPQNLSELIATLAIANPLLPWLTLLSGGLGGAVLTYFLNRRISRNKTPRLSITASTLVYSMKERWSQDLKISYQERTFERLIRYTIDVENTSNRSVSPATILLKFGTDAELIFDATTTSPVNRPIALQKVESNPGTFNWELGELRPTDKANLQVLLANNSNLVYLWRGSDDVELSHNGKTEGKSIEGELQSVVFFLAIYTSMGFIPFLSSLARALLLIMFAPHIAAAVIRWTKIIKESLNRPPELSTYITIDQLSGSHNTVIGAIRDGSDLRINHAFDPNNT